MMKPRGSALLALLGASAFVAACSVETGKVRVDVTCEEEGCVPDGGALHASIVDCDEDVGTYGRQVRTIATFGTAQTHTFGFENVLEGTRCVQVFLDRDTSGNVSAGDIVSTEAIAQGVGEEDDDEDDDTDDDAELTVEVDEDESASLDFVLDAIVLDTSLE